MPRLMTLITKEILGLFKYVMTLVYLCAGDILVAFKLVVSRLFTISLLMAYLLEYKKSFIVVIKEFILIYMFCISEFIKVAGACSLLVVFSLSGLAFFSILHVAMQLQRRIICVSYQRAVFLKVLFSSVAG